MAKITKKHQKAITKVIHRWAETLSGTRAPDMEKVRRIFNQTYIKRKGRVKGKTVQLSPPTLITVKSPMAFKVAQAVMRGYLSKKLAKEVCKAFGIADDFLASLRRDKQIEIFKTARAYSWQTTQICQAWNSTLLEDIRAAVFAGLNSPDFAEARLHEQMLEKYKQWCTWAQHEHKIFRDEAVYGLDNNDLLKICTPKGSVSSGWGSSSRRLSFGNFFCNDPGCDGVARLFYVPWSYGCNVSTRSRMTELELSTTYGTTAIDAEILFNRLGIKDIAQTGAVELLHEIPLFMTFQTQVLICSERPVIKFNANNELHCDDGPAVSWSDGAGQYYLDGHALGRLGYKIITAPDQLTANDIRHEENEEVKRIAIEKFGWGRYLAAINAVVLDRRENWVDNTIEAVIRIVEQRERYDFGTRRNEPISIPQHKMILSCRSTCRQYFLAIPDTVRTCEEGQNWMAEGGNTPYVPALSRRVRLVGAS